MDISVCSKNRVNTYEENEMMASFVKEDDIHAVRENHVNDDFKALMAKVIGLRTVDGFARECDISSSVMTALLSGNKCPEPELLLKVANHAWNDVTFLQLLRTWEYNAHDAARAVDGSRSNVNTDNRLIRSMDGRKAFADTLNVLCTETGKKYNSPDEFALEFTLKMNDTLMTGACPVYDPDLRQTHIVPDAFNKNADDRGVVTYELVGDEKAVDAEIREKTAGILKSYRILTVASLLWIMSKTEAAVAKACCRELDFVWHTRDSFCRCRTVLCYMSDGKSCTYCFVVPCGAAVELLYSEVIKADGSEDRTCLAPYILYISLDNHEYFAKPIRSDKEMLADLLYGEGRTYEKTIDGDIIGFYTDGISEETVEKAILSRKWAGYEECDIGKYESTPSDTSGTWALYADLLRIETGLSFVYEAADDVNPRGVFGICYYPDHCSRKTVLDAVRRAAEELGVERYGSVYTIYNKEVRKEPEYQNILA